MSMTNAEAIKEIRSDAKRAGLTFKSMNTRINGVYMWKFTDRKTGETIISNCTLGSAYENCCSGYIASYNKETRYFEGISKD